MKKKDTFLKYAVGGVALLAGVLYVARFGGPPLLRLYVETGIGSCEKIPVLCMRPQPVIVDPAIDRQYVAEMLPYRFDGLYLRLPRGFTVVKEGIKKVYHKKYERKGGGNVAYLFDEEPGFFKRLFPQLVKYGVETNYEFIRRTMSGRLPEIKGLADVFFVVMKASTLPDLGDLAKTRMAQCALGDTRVFINYTLSESGNFFDCNIIDAAGNFFKVYIKDKTAGLDLDKVMAIVSTVRRQG